MVLLLILSKYICVYWILSKCTLRDWVQVHLYPIATFTDSRIKPTARQPKKWYLIVGNFWETNCFFSATQRKLHDLRSWITAEARDHTIHDLCYKHKHQDMPLESLCFLWVQNSTSFANHAVYRGLVDNISRRRCRSIRPHTPGKLILIVYFFCVWPFVRNRLGALLPRKAFAKNIGNVAKCAEHHGGAKSVRC